MVVSPHIGQGIDGTAFRIASHIDTSHPVLPITRINNYRFNEELNKYETAVILDYCEYNWNWDLEKSGTHFFGKNTEGFPEQFSGSEWKKFDEWVRTRKSVVYFKRELLINDRKKNVFPIDYPCWLSDLPAIQTKDQYNERQIEVFFYWGRSHEERLMLHSEIWTHGVKSEINICDNLFFLNKFIEEEKGRKWVTVNIPHYSRMDITAILSINGISKISVAMPGAGRKTFRGTGESPVNSVVLLKEDNLAYSYPFVHNKNCIKFSDFGEEIDRMEEALNNPMLYEIYVQSVETCMKYQIKNYAPNYIERIIKENI